MSQRMKDPDFHRRFNARHLTDLQVSDLRDEAARARSEEARLLEENRKQGEQIKALADALERSARWLGWNDETPCWCEDAHQHETAQRQDCKLNTAALRLCGRIP